MSDELTVKLRSNLAPVLWPCHPFEDSVRFKRFSGYQWIKPGEIAIFINVTALKEMESHAASTAESEVFGILVGEYCAFETLSFVLIDAVVSSKTAHSEAARVEVTPEDWNALYDERVSKYPNLRQVGWYHSHPNWGVFLSQPDLRIHRQHFPRQFHVAFVIDPLKQTLDCGFFLWNEGEITERRGFFMYEGTEMLRDWLDEFRKSSQASAVDPEAIPKPDSPGLTELDVLNPEESDLREPSGTDVPQPSEAITEFDGYTYISGEIPSSPQRPNTRGHTAEWLERDKPGI